jgi:S-adenosylmethionine hydrolase
MIALFTDFGVSDPYVGQMHAAIARIAPRVRVIDLFHTVPNFDIRAGAYLLAAYAEPFPEGTVFVAVVDPGVGGSRIPVMLWADGRWFVGPDNGLFHIVARRARRLVCREILWRPASLSPSFHGRDLFAPAAAMLATGRLPHSRTTALTAPREPWPDDLEQVLYIDHYGNAVTGIRAGSLRHDEQIRVGEYMLTYARVFSDVEPGQAFWYENANGLIEIAVNGASAAEYLGLRLGDRVARV